MNASPFSTKSMSDDEEPGNCGDKVKEAATSKAVALDNVSASRIKVAGVKVNI